MKNRSRADIIGVILRSAMPGAVKTKLGSRAYLSYAQLKEYLAFVQERDLVAYDQGLHLYKLTPKGLRFLNAYDQIKEDLALMNSKGPGFS